MLQTDVLLIAPDACEENGESDKSCHWGPVSQALTVETTDGAGDPVTHIPTCHIAVQDALCHVAACDAFSGVCKYRTMFDEKKKAKIIMTQHFLLFK